MPSPSPSPKLEYSLPLIEINIALSSKTSVPSVLDTSSQIVIIRQDLARQVSTKVNPHCIIEVEGTNSARSCTVGCAKYLPLQVGDILL